MLIYGNNTDNIYDQYIIGVFMFKKFLKIMFLIPALFLTGVTISAANEQNAIDYEDINKVLRFVMYDAKSEMTSMHTFVSIAEKDEAGNEITGITLDDVKLWITTNDGQIYKIEIDKKGNFKLPLLSEAEAEGSKFNINEKNDYVSVHLHKHFKPPKELEIFYSELFLVLEDVNNLISEMKGALSWFTPSLDALKLRFDQKATVKIMAKKKMILYETDEKFSITIVKKRKLMKENTIIIFSSHVKTIDPE